MPFVFLSPPDGAAAKRTLPIASTHPAGTDPQPLPESGQAPTGSNHGAEDSAPEKAGADPKKRPPCHPASGKTVPCPGRRFRFRPVIRKPPTGRIPGTEPESPHPENRFFPLSPVRSPLSPDNGNDLPHNSLLRKTARPGRRFRFRPAIRKPPTGIPGTESESPHPENRFPPLSRPEPFISGQRQRLATELTPQKDRPPRAAATACHQPHPKKRSGGAPCTPPPENRNTPCQNLCTARTRKRLCLGMFSR